MTYFELINQYEETGIYEKVFNLAGIKNVDSSSIIWTGTALVETKVTGGAWITATSGGAISGLPSDFLAIRITIARTSLLVSPEITNATVEIVQDGEVVFYGVVGIPESPTYSSGFETDIYNLQIQSANALLRRRTISEAYQNKTTPEIIQDIFTKYLEGEGVTLGAISDIDFTYDIFVAQRKYVADVLDELVAPVGATWHISPDKKFYFLTKEDFTTIGAPTHLSAIKKSVSGLDTRTVQIIAGATAQTDTQTETTTWAADTKQILANFPLVAEPTITINDPEAASFDGVDDYIDCGNDNSINPTAQITIETNIFPTTDILAQDACLYSSGRSGGNLIGYISAGEFLVYVYLGGSWHSIVANAIIPTNEWTHVALVYDSSNGLYFYVNGVLDNSDTALSGNIEYDETSNVISAYTSVAGAPEKYFEGYQKDVRIWNTTRTQAEIQANMNLTIPPTTGLVASYPLEKDVLDYSGNGNDGVNHGVTFVNGTAATVVNATVGLNGLESDDVTKTFLWANQSNFITLNTLATVKPATGDTVVISYIGVFEIEVENQNTLKIAEIKALTGTSGRIEKVETDTTIKTYGDGNTLANKLLDRYGESEETITCFTDNLDDTDLLNIWTFALTDQKIVGDYIIVERTIRRLTDEKPAVELVLKNKQFFLKYGTIYNKYDKNIRRLSVSAKSVIIKTENTYNETLSLGETWEQAGLVFYPTAADFSDPTALFYPMELQA